MRSTMTFYGLLMLALATGAITLSTDANAQEKPDNAGPPVWVVDAWVSGVSPVAPVSGPPAWVVEAWQNGEMPQRPLGPPAWVAARHEIAKELGLPGPPPEVLEAWKNGEGNDLPGPPSFVLDILGL